MNEIKLVCKRVIFYFQKDEAAFFWWIKKIKAIIKYDGQGDELYLYFNSNIIPDDDLRDLIGLFYRYKIPNMNQLQIFVNENNMEWFKGSPKGFWYYKVFGK